MQAVLLLVHLVICVALIGLVLLQRSEGGALGIGGGSGALMTGRGAADTLARMTSFAGGFFLLTSIALTAMSGAAHQGRSIFDSLPASQSQPLTTTAPAPLNTTPATTPPATDPTQSSAPQSAPPTELAAIETAAPPPSSVTVAPSPNLSAARAGPVRQASATPTTTIAAPTRTPPQTTATTIRPPAQTTSTTVRTTQTTAPAMNIPGVQLQGSGTAPVQTNPSRNSGNTATTTPALAAPNPESSQSQAEAVRRERAGPDQ